MSQIPTPTYSVPSGTDTWSCFLDYQVAAIARPAVTYGLNSFVIVQQGFYMLRIRQDGRYWLQSWLSTLPWWKLSITTITTISATLPWCLPSIHKAYLRSPEQYRPWRLGVDPFFFAGIEAEIYPDTAHIGNLFVGSDLHAWQHWRYLFIPRQARTSCSPNRDHLQGGLCHCTACACSLRHWPHGTSARGLFSYWLWILIFLSD